MNFFIIHSILIGMKCSICNKKLVGRQTKFCSRVCRNQEINKRHKNYEAQQIRGADRKIALIKEMGGKCEICGYHKNYSALTFHHKDPSEKKMTLDVRTMSNSSMVGIKEEAAKCQLLCFNCHMEVHYPHNESGGR